MKWSIVVATLFFIPLFSFCQNLTNYQDTVKRLQFGFLLGCNYSQIQTSNGVNDTDYFLENEMGFTLGIVVEYQMNSKLKSINTMETSFYNGSVTYVDNLYLRHQKLEWTNMELGTRLNWSPFNNLSFSPYLTIGPEIQFEMTQRTSSTWSKPRYAVNIGVGFDKQLQLFRIAPEVLYSYGLSDIGSTGTLPSMKMHNISLMLYFKG